MKRCPNCNRTYANDSQKFCTKDGTSLVTVSASLAQGETVRLDSAELGTTQFDPEATKVIPRQTLPQPSGDFDPFKTIMAKPPETTSDISVTTGDLMPASMPPQPSPWSTGRSGPIEPPPPSAPLPQPPSSAPLPPPQGSGPINAPSQPLQNSSDDVGQLTMASFAPPPLAASRPLPINAAVAAATAPVPAHAPAQPKKKSKLPLVLGILAVLFVLGLGGLGAAYWFVVRPMLEKSREVRNDNTEPARQPTPTAANTPNETTPPKTDNVKEVPPYSPPADAVQFVNSKDRLDGKLAEHYVDFSFYYPKHWRKDPTAGVAGASNFAKVERRLPPDFTQENFAVGWYASAGSEEGDRAAFPGLAANLSSQFAKGFSEYRKVSEGSVKVGAYDGYEFRFESISRNTEHGDIKIWGRVIFLPPVNGGTSGVTLLMLATSLADELKTVNDVGVKGELPMMLDSFRFGK
ncbi:MAG TPA: hypothetical protein VN476_05890 [Pyrinomonadaceae bacterium]|nr:hypothetical protein [Pyrinomonadaceae bacterium]